MEKITFLEAIISFVCFLGVVIMFMRLLSKDRCPHGGTHDWELHRDYQMITMYKCRKCGEIKTIDKLNND